MSIRILASLSCNAIGILSLMFAPEVIRAAPNADRTCSASASPLFQEGSVNDAIELTLMSDYKTFGDRVRSSQGKPATIEIRGLLAAETRNGQIEYHPVIIAGRGNSRAMFCDAPPYRLKFVDETLKASLENSLRTFNLAPGSPEYLKRYYELFLESTLTPSNLENAKGKGVFAKIGDDVKVVSHCGQSHGWEHVGGKSEKEQDDKLLSEFTIYKIAATLNYAIESVRLAEIDYRDSNGLPLYTRPRFALFREPPKALAKRCGLKTKSREQMEEEGYGYEDDELSKFQAQFLNRFLYNTDYNIDGRNVHEFFDEQNKRYFGPYDFDLSGVFTDEYAKVSLDDNLASMEKMLNSTDRTLSSSVVQNLLSKRAHMHAVIEQSKLSPERKARFQAWFKKYMDAVATWARNNGLR